MLVALMAILPLSIFAQKKQSKPVERYFYISAEGGLSINHTDLANYGGVAFYQNGAFTLDEYFLKNYNGKVGLGYQFSKVMGVNAKFGTATLAGENHGWNLIPGGLAATSDLQLDPTNRTQFMEANLNLTFNFTNLFFGYNPRRVFNFIPHIGIGGIYYQPGQVNQLPRITDANGNGAATATLVNKPADHDPITYTIPLGAEINFNVARMLDIYIDYTYALTGTDNMDQTTKVNELDNIFNKNDMYSALNLGLRLKFNKKPCDIDAMAANAKKITYTVNPNPLEEKDGKVCCDVTFNIPGGYFEKEAVMNITPTMTFDGGEVELEPVTFVGEKVDGGDYQVNYKNGGQFTKNYCMDYVPGMENGKLIANPMFYVYNGTIYPTQEEIVKNTYFAQGGDKIIAEGVLVPVVKCEVSNINTIVKENTVTVKWNGDAASYDVRLGDKTVEGVKANTYTFENVEPGNYEVYVKAICSDDLVGEWQKGKNAEIIPERKPIAIFYFDYNSAELKPNTKMNKEAALAVAEKLASGEAIHGFEIEGWASPEGELQLNNKLADNRATAGEKAIKNQMKKVKIDEKNFTFSSKGFGPDWNLFIELVQNSNIKDKDQIVRVINNAGSQAKKEQEIKNMIQIYPELEKDILPLIRRAEVYVK